MRRHLSILNKNFEEHSDQLDAFLRLSCQVVEIEIAAANVSIFSGECNKKSISRLFAAARLCSDPCVSFLHLVRSVDRVESFAPENLPEKFPLTIRARETCRDDVALKPNLFWQRDIDRIVSRK